MADLTFADVITFARNSTVNGWTAGPVLTEFATDAPAFVIDPATGQSLGYRALAGFTNLSLRSSAFDQSPWSTFNASIAANVSGVTAPDGTETVDRLDSESDSGNRLVQQDITASESTTYTLSVFAKAADIDTFLLRENQNDGIQASFDLTDGTANLGLGDSADIESVGNGWFRCMVTGTTEAGQTNYRAEVRLGGSSLTDSIYVWGAQLVEGVIAGPPIETEGSPVSTDPDDGTESVPTGLQSAGTLVINARTANGVSGDQVLAQMDDGTENNRVRIVRNSSREVHYIVTDGGSEVANMNLGTVADDTDTKVAIRYGDDDYAGIVSGGTLQTDTTGTMPAISTLRHGRDTGDGEEWNGTIAEVRGNNAWTDSQLEGAV